VSDKSDRVWGRQARSPKPNPPATAQSLGSTRIDNKFNTSNLSATELTSSHSDTFTMSELVLIVVLAIGFIALPLSLFPSIANPLLQTVGTVLLALWNFSKLFVLGVSALLLLLGGEHLYRQYLRSRGVIDPDFAAAELHGREREGREERMKNEVEAFARTTGIHGLVKGAFKALTETRLGRGAATTGGKAGAGARAKAGADKGVAPGALADDIELKPVRSSTGTPQPRREGLRQRAAGSPAPVYR